MTPVIVRSATRAEAGAWERMRETLWPSVPGEHAAEIAGYFNGESKNQPEVLLAFDAYGEVVGFVELSIRSNAEECYSGRVAYLEGWYVDQAHRRSGVGRALVGAAEDWGRSQGCTEMASDTEINNAPSAAAHEAAGFEETNRVITYRKTL